MAMLPLNSDMVVMMKTIMMLLQQGGGLTCKGGMSVPQVLRLFLSLSHILLLPSFYSCSISILSLQCNLLWLDVDIPPKEVGEFGKARM